MEIIISNGQTIIKTGDKNGGVKNKWNRIGISQHQLKNELHFRAEIQVNRKKYFLHYYPTIEEAIAIREEAERQVENGTFEKWYAALRKKAVAKRNKNSYTGINQKKMANGLKYEVNINYKRKKYYIGHSYDLKEAIAMRKEAELHLKEGDLVEWVESLKADK
jgi:hypothetical protein